MFSGLSLTQLETLPLGCWQE